MKLANDLYRTVPVGVGSKGKIVPSEQDMDAILTVGAAWAVVRGWGLEAYFERIEQRGTDADAKPEFVSENARKRQREEMGTLSD